MAQDTYEIRSCNPKANTNLLWIGGSCGAGLAHRDCFELAKDGAIAWQAAIQWDLFCSPFKSQLVWKEANAALFGSHGEVYALDLHTGAVLFHQTLGSYFGSFEIDPIHHLLLVLTGEEILAFNQQLELLWAARGLAVDGIVCHEIGETLTVDAEMDPPGGWQRVTIDLDSGAELTRESKPRSRRP
ncbi:MAG: hypothetical protein K2X81_04335 [Candidatus Obscuribacterales bacterium]|nr:hypothetical protein [Candidatus Obscuribacterales bacterium]